MDPGFGGAYDGSFLVDGQATSVNVTGLIGLTNYEVMVNGFTVKDGPGNVTYLQTEEGGRRKIALKCIIISSCIKYKNIKAALTKLHFYELERSWQPVRENKFLKAACLFSSAY